MVTDDPVPNAYVTAKIGELSFNTTADSAGKYSITIDTTEAQLKNVITLIAEGDSTSRIVKFASQLGDLSSLMAQAGDDKTLDAAENINVNISNLTTAEYVLLNESKTITSEPELQSALNSLDVNKELELAAMIKLIINDSNYAFPEGIKNTFELLKNKLAAENYLNWLKLNNRDNFIDALNDIRSDKNIVSYTPNSIVGNYIVRPKKYVSGFYVVKFNEDNSGEFISLGGKVGFNWSEQSNTFSIIPTTPVDLNLTDSVGPDYILGKWHITSVSFQVIWDNKVSKSVEWTQKRNLLSQDGAILASDTQVYVTSLTELSKTIPLTSAMFQGRWLLSSSQDVLNIEFNADKSLRFATTSYPEEQKTANWNIASNLSLTEFGGSVNHRIDLYAIADLNVGYEVLQIETEGDSTIAYTGKLIKSQSLNLKRSDFEGVWWEDDLLWSYGDFRFTGIGGWQTSWRSIGNNTMEIDIFAQNGPSYLFECNTLASAPCTKNAYGSYKVVAVDGGDFWGVNRWQNSGSNDYNSATPNYTLSLRKKTAYPTIFGNWLFQATPNFYQQTLEGIKVWRFSMQQDLDTAHYSLVISDNAGYIYDKDSVYVFDGRLHYKGSKILELIQSNINGMEVCEYEEGQKCEDGERFFLSNRNPAKITLAVNGQGYLDANDSTTANYQLQGFGNVMSYQVNAAYGHTLSSLIGCGGELVGNVYNTSPLKSSCTITATFVPVP